jgi:hypothetical protein
MFSFFLLFTTHTLQARNSTCGVSWHGLYNKIHQPLRRPPALADCRCQMGKTSKLNRNRANSNPGDYKIICHVVNLMRQVRIFRGDLENRPNPLWWSRKSHKSFAVISKISQTIAKYSRQNKQHEGFRLRKVKHLPCSIISIISFSGPRNSQPSLSSCLRNDFTIWKFKTPQTDVKIPRTNLTENWNYAILPSSPANLWNKQKL